LPTGSVDVERHRDPDDLERRFSGLDAVRLMELTIANRAFRSSRTTRRGRRELPEAMAWRRMSACEFAAGDLLAGRAAHRMPARVA
jgi:hypothetical protein